MRSALELEVDHVHEMLSGLMPQPVNLRARLRPWLRRSPVTLVLPLLAAGLVWLGVINDSFLLAGIGGGLLLLVLLSFLVVMLWDIFRETPEREFLTLSRGALDRQTAVVATLTGGRPETLQYMQSFYAEQIASVEGGMALLLGPLRTLGLVAWFGAFIAAYSAIIQVLPGLKGGAPFALAAAVGLALAGLRAEDGLQAMRRRRDLLGRIVALQKAQVAGVPTVEVQVNA